jgi:hypothetical protein
MDDTALIVHRSPMPSLASTPHVRPKSPPVAVEAREV